ncbi:MAG: selenocysteine lyase [Bdellovibrionales bacterium CG12_big_fil_rev_8_21_14_0_65_38_15]|nr:MAG: selenocysteine lyase [Bdellovibrionales bacterium CG22_combo_CG10-13_8_21_14_all_38_13]PIQ57294.1 MAG: selenocysteine lyase [Bdellovibrionales bacterium CG12_big_fil_rev_8_21_14_0_65_38_15]PIR28840.1 MAG: selenocysteine lyase [Bdellovibrionales bacterium CG11_big_fil_rev_8_21_14_0_20_38_13]
MSFKKYYQHFLKAHGDVLHMACHSHHFWPDVTRQATLDYWDDSAKHSDQKWGIIFGEKIPKLQSHIAKTLKIDKAENIVFAPNTHDLLIRLLSTLPTKRKPRILTTDGEFHSFSRQINKLVEEDLIEITKVSSFPSNSFWSSFEDALNEKNFDMIFISQIFYNSGTSIDDLERIVKLADKHGKIIIDGYHSYFTRPLDLSKIQNKIYFMSGHYKYAQGGEGLCFMTCPDDGANPVITGWFAEFEALSSKTGEVTYPTHAGRYLGSTMDFTPLYRSLSVYDLFEKEGITLDVIRSHILKLQKKFLEIIKEVNHTEINEKSLIQDESQERGQFLAFKLESTQACQDLEQGLRSIGILTDSRANILRFGFSLYQDELDFERLRRIKDL